MIKKTVSGKNRAEYSLNIHFYGKINRSISPKNNCTIGYILINFLLLKILLLILDQRQKQ